MEARVWDKTRLELGDVNVQGATKRNEAVNANDPSVPLLTLVYDGRPKTGFLRHVSQSASLS